MSLRLPSSRRKRPSAIGLRQIFPVQTKRTLFTVSGRRVIGFAKYNQTESSQRAATHRVQLPLPQIEKERKTERETDEQSGEDRQPDVRDAHGTPFDENKEEEDDRGNDDVEAEERAD